MRTEASIRNSIFATATMLLKILIGFIAQKLFVLLLNAEYLGANGLFSNVITVLNLAELGVGQAIVFNMYKPIANNDKEKIKSLMRLYQKAYNIIALVVLAIGCALIPFLDLFIGETTLDLNFTLVYILFLLQCVVSYMFTYKRNILYAYQENYIISVVDLLYVFLSNLLQLVLLYIYRNYYLYLALKIICVFVENLCINHIANKKYPFLKENNVKELDEDFKKDIFNRIKATFYHKVGSVVVNGTDNIIISKFLGLVTVGLYSNYYMIIYYVGELIRQMISSLTPSVGSLLVEAEQEKVYKVYKKIEFFDFWLSAFSATAILVIIQNFIELWMGKGFVLPFFVVIVLVLNYYLKMMRQVNDVFLNAAGICIETKYVPLIESAVNIFFSIILLKPFGLAGVFIGTIISSMALWCYTYPKFIYKKILGGKYSDYIKENIKYLFLFIAIAILTCTLASIIKISNLWIKIIFNGIICLIIPNLILFALYRKTEEFGYFKNLVIDTIKSKIIRR